MIDFNDWEMKLKKLTDIYAKFGNNFKFNKDDSTASEQELCELETRIQFPIPPSLRVVFLQYSKKIEFYGWLPDKINLPDSLRKVFSACFDVSLEEVERAEKSRKGWVENCFANPDDPYDNIWHNKLGFMNVANGDVIAFDLSDEKEDKRVVYLSHDDGEGHGYILGNNFEDYFSKLLLIGACGNEDWQMLPFISDSISGINPNCDNAKIYREIIGLFW